MSGQSHTHANSEDERSLGETQRLQTAAQPLLKGVAQALARADLSGRRVLVVEDEYLIADDMRWALSAVGVEVVGPLSTVAEAAACVASGETFDAAVLDVKLQGEMIFPVAEALERRGIPYMFATGYDQWSLPDRFAGAARLDKPFELSAIAAAIGDLLQPAPPDDA